jgi:hypothetical protein
MACKISEAKEVYRKHSHLISDEHRYGGMPAGLKNAWSKMRAYLIRLSPIMAVCRVAESADDEVEEITAADVENAAALVKYFKGTARKAHGQINRFDTSSKVAYELVSLLREKDGEIKATSDELRQMLPSAPDTAEATSKLVERISKEHDFIEFGRGWRHDGRVITIRLTEKTVGTVGTVGETSGSSDILERKPEFASCLATQQHRDDGIGDLALVVATDPDKFAWDVEHDTAAQAALQQALTEWRRS